MNTKTVLNLLSLMMAGAVHAGKETHGGDVVVCQADPTLNTFAGNYTLDFLAGFDAFENTYPYFEAKTIEESFARIRKIFTANMPNWVDRFDEFVESYGKNDILSSRSWEPAHWGLVDVQDENLMRMLPTNCRGQQQANTRASITQAVLRQQTTTSERIIYQYDVAVLKNLSTDRPMQFSFLMIHEFLRDFTHDPEQIRTINWMLHSQAGLDFEWQKVLRNAGLADAEISAAKSAQLANQHATVVETLTAYQQGSLSLEDVRKVIEKTSDLVFESYLNINLVYPSARRAQLARGRSEIGFAVGQLGDTAILELFLKRLNEKAPYKQFVDYLAKGVFNDPQEVNWSFVGEASTILRAHGNSNILNFDFSKSLVTTAKRSLHQALEVLQNLEPAEVPLNILLSDALGADAIDFARFLRTQGATSYECRSLRSPVLYYQMTTGDRVEVHVLVGDSQVAVVALAALGGHLDKVRFLVEDLGFEANPLVSTSIEKSKMTEYGYQMIGDPKDRIIRLSEVLDKMLSNANEVWADLNPQLKDNVKLVQKYLRSR